MPESLTPELIELRDKCQTFAAEHLVGSNNSAETRANIRAAAKSAGSVRKLTFDDGSSSRGRQLCASWLA